MRYADHLANLPTVPVEDPTSELRDRLNKGHVRVVKTEPARGGRMLIEIELTAEGFAALEAEYDK